MFWADEILQNRPEKEWINDAWTPSGIIHMGGLKGPVIHDTLYRLLKEQGKDVKYTFGFDDMDAIDGLPASLQEKLGEYMGIPVCNAPSPDGNGSFGDYYSQMMKDMFKALDIQAEIYLASDYYKKGVYNKAIQFVLDNADKVRKVYEEMYKKKIADTWFPLQVVCPNCGKVGTTEVTAWDGKEVAYTCRIDKVKWAKGCEQTGKISPFDGNATMPFKVEWAAKWWTFKVTIEGAGKDHASAGGTYDIARKLVKDVFGQEPPLWLPYEFFLYDGKKMSSSKGLGLTGQQLLEVIPPQMVRFLMTRTEPNQAVEFNPNGTLIIPKLYEEYQKAAESNEDYLKKPYDLSQVYGKNDYLKVRFLTLAQWVQMPNMEEEIKKEGLEQWAKYAKVWVEKYAPESEKFAIKKDVPEEAKSLSGTQKDYLKKLSEKVDTKDAEAFQLDIYNLAKDIDLPSKDAFQAIYLSLLGKDHGPKAAWLILSLDSDFVKKRFQEVIASEISVKSEKQAEEFTKSDLFSISQSVKEKYPTVSVGIAVIKGVKIQKTDEKLEQEKQTLLDSLSSLSTEELGTFPEVIAYRKLYKDMGIDWHSRRPSPEALLRRVALKKGLYTINTVVDAYNLIVMKHRVSIGAFDLDKIVFPTELKFPESNEEILLLGDEKPTMYKETELAYFDKTGGFNLDFNYRDAQRTAVQLETKNLYINVDGISDITSERVEKVLKEAVDKIIEYNGGTLEEFSVSS